MRVFVNDYTKSFAYVIIGLIFAYSSFYLIANIYHYEEVNKIENISFNEVDSYKKIVSNIIDIKNNVDVDYDKYDGNTKKVDIIQLYNNLNNCVNYIDNSYIKEMAQKDKYNIYDVERFRSVVNNEIVNNCLVDNIYYITYNDNYSFLSNSKSYIKINIDSINSKMDYINKNINDNSSLYFSTMYANTYVYNKISDNYMYLLDIYKESTDIILEISSQFNKEVS